MIEFFDGIGLDEAARETGGMTEGVEVHGCGVGVLIFEVGGGNGYVGGFGEEGGVVGGVFFARTFFGLDGLCCCLWLHVWL